MTQQIVPLRPFCQKQSGFTLLEALIVIVVVGIITAIAAPGWFRFIESNRLNASQDELYLGIREAQTKAQRQSTDWQFSLREVNGLLEWTTHPKSVLPQTVQWQALSYRSVQIDTETSFAKSGGIYYVRFNKDGDVQYRLGRITLSSRNAPNIKRCVIVSTLIGATRKSKEQATPRDGKLCY